MNQSIAGRVNHKLACVFFYHQIQSGFLSLNAANSKSMSCFWYGFSCSRIFVRQGLSLLKSVKHMVMLERCANSKKKSCEKRLHTTSRTERRMSAFKEKDVFKKGCMVKLIDLQSKSSWNGKYATIIGSFVKDKRRWPIRLHEEQYTALIKTSNLILHIDCNGNGIMQTQTYVVGVHRNGCLRKLTRIQTKYTKYNEPKYITNIYTGFSYFIFTNNNQHFWAEGNNNYGSCVGYNNDGSTCDAIDFFMDNNIKISKVCCNLSGQTTFWITDKNNMVYGNGLNLNKQLGLINDDWCKFKPVLIKGLQNIIDVQSAARYSIALGNIDLSHHRIIAISHHWSTQILSMDLIDLIFIFCNTNKVYATPLSGGGGNGLQNEYNWNDDGWKEIKMFANHHIVQISVGLDHSMFLDSNGRLYSCGKNDSGKLGLDYPGDLTWTGTSGKVGQPKLIKYFQTHSIRIKHVECGKNHSIAIDRSYKCYAWGSNAYGQCGHKRSVGCIQVPKRIDGSIGGLQIVNVKCGGSHSYVMTKDNVHFLFGLNDWNQCITFDGREIVYGPFCINPIIEQKCNGMIIKTISLGIQSTYFVLTTKQCQ
eukprot:798047_1